MFKLKQKSQIILKLHFQNIQKHTVHESTAQ